ncbi:WXG100 family type VII secretion target [Bacillus cereus group sp. BfR-BA-01453]|uniref:WXG100 family type VII secretion target n=1 Tax=Bacillus cereus group sp. BfR-BA-01453 TaxID=2920355 RepID=UPI001F593556|nr:WXG100 family type VII secretion target [Bacillus cereus group sp. BfR-BA-01453]
MGDIKVTPEQLRKVAGTIRSTITNATATQERLKRDIDMISSNWLGSTYMKFNTDFRDSSFKMAQFITILEPLEKFLLDSANKFEQVDNMDVAIAMASGILNKNNDKVEYLTGKAEGAEGDRLGGKLEGTVVNGEFELSKDSKINTKFGTGSAELNIPYSKETLREDASSGNLIGGKVEGRAQETSYVRTDIPYMEDITVTQKMHDFSSIVGYDEYTAKVGAEYSSRKYELLLEKIDVPDIIPYFSDHDITIRLELGVGTYGYKLHMGQEKGFYASYEGFGGGFFLKPEKKE